MTWAGLMVICGATKMGFYFDYFWVQLCHCWFSVFVQSFSQRGLHCHDLSDIRLSRSCCTKGGLCLIPLTCCWSLLTCCLLWPLISPLCFQGGFEMGRLLHAGCRTHPAGLLLLHRVPPAGGAGSKDSEPAAGEQDQTAAEYAAGKSFTVVID